MDILVATEVTSNNSCGNQDDKTKFAHLFEEFQKQWTSEGVQGAAEYNEIGNIYPALLKG
jgi:hypothetical protein